LAQAIGCVGWQKLVKSFFFLLHKGRQQSLTGI